VMRRRIRIGCDFTFVAAANAPVIFQVRPGESAGLAVDGEQWSSQPLMAIGGYTDLYGNPCTRAVLPTGRSRFGYHAVAAVPDAAENADETAPETAPDALPDDTLIYILPSRYCLPDVLADEAWSRFAGYRRGTGGCRRSVAMSTTISPSSTAARRRCRRRPTSTRPGWGLPRLHPPCDLVLPGTEHPRPLRLRLPARPGRPAGPGAHGLRGLDGGLAR
jgi:hypothetical protein